MQSTLFSSSTRRRLFLLSLLALAAATLAADTPSEAWLAEYRRYVAQPNIPTGAPADPASPSGFGDLMRRLPAPEEWPHLRQALKDAASHAAPGAEQKRLQAGSWLFAYLSGDRTGLMAELPPKPAPEAMTSEEAIVVLQMHEALDPARGQGGDQADQLLQAFKQQVEAVEPVNVDEVKRALGGEENFARLHRLLDADEAMRPKVTAVYEEYQKTGDQAAAEQKMQVLQKEYEDAYGADQQALEPYRQNPLIGRYVSELWRTRQPDGYAPSAAVPDLVKLLGKDEARALVRRALAVPIQLMFDEHTGAETRLLLREEALAAIATLKVASWGLVTDAADAPLFEALDKRFPATADRSYSYRTASGFYLLALMQQSKIPEAVAFASRPEFQGRLNLPYEISQALEKGGNEEQLWAFLRAWLRKFPASDEWDRFNRLSASLGHQRELKAMVAEMAADGSFAGLSRLRVQLLQADFELAIDDLTGARTRLAALLAPVAATADERRIQLEVAGKLLSLADLQQDGAQFQATLAAAEAVLAAGEQGEEGTGIQQTANLIEILNTAGRFGDSVRLGDAVLARLAEQMAKADAKQAETLRRLGMDYRLRQLLGEMLRARVELGQWTEAAQLVENSPWWGVRDVQGLLNEKVPSNSRPLGWYFARLAHQQGHAEIEQQLLEMQLVATPGSDPIYQSYLELTGPEAKPLLAKLIAADRYEERPLIWRAKLESDAGQWDAAIATLQEAIQIDPSDGEEGRGDRMRVYAFMARAVGAKGDKEKAVFFENVVKSIRLSETADRWFTLGAYAHAIALYRQALGFFQDAYCIQSRLAVRLAGEGKMDEAAEHYRRAFELMPDSFGRVESHCFGCEHVFAGEKSQGVAEEVFTKMLAARPDKPQLHYLMGYLREEQNRDKEAADYYRQAIKLDPLYLNAWKQLAGLDGKLHFTPAERDDLYLKLVEMDPMRRHGYPSLDRVGDLPRLWRALQAAQQVVARLPAAQPVWPLKASTALLASDTSGYRSYGPTIGQESFATVLAQHEFIMNLQGYLVSLNAAPEGAEPNSSPTP